MWYLPNNLDWVMKSSKIADKREAKMLRDYSQARRISETAKNKAVSKTELIFRQSQTWLVQEIQPKIDEIIRNLTMRQIIDGYNKQLIRTMKLPEAKAIRLLDTFPVAYIQELLDVLEIVGLNNTSIELAAKLGLSSQGSSTAFNNIFSHIHAIFSRKIKLQLVKQNSLAKTDKSDFVTKFIGGEIEIR